MSGSMPDRRNGSFIARDKFKAWFFAAEMKSGKN